MNDAVKIKSAQSPKPRDSVSPRPSLVNKKKSQDVKFEMAPRSASFIDIKGRNRTMSHLDSAPTKDLSTDRNSTTSNNTKLQLSLYPS